MDISSGYVRICSLKIKTGYIYGQEDKMGMYRTMEKIEVCNECGP